MEPISPFHIFTREQRNILFESQEFINQEGHTDTGAVQLEIKKKWEEMSEEEKKIYEEKAEKEREIYMKEVEEKNSTTEENKLTVRKDVDIDNEIGKPDEEGKYDFTKISNKKKFPRLHHQGDIRSRIFANKVMNLDKIKYFGFDMDYTLCEYTDEYEELCFRMAKERLVHERGYPKEILQLSYKPELGQRGLFLDKKFGHMLKIDNFGYILAATHGMHKLKKHEIRKFYPQKIINDDLIGKRYHTFTSPFGKPEISLYSLIVHYFESRKMRIASHDDFGALIAQDSSSDDEEEVEEVIEPSAEENEANISYWSLFDDVRDVCHKMHIDGTLKSETVEEIEKYVHRSEDLALLFDRMRDQNKKIFLLTNSGHGYTESIMEYLLGSYLTDKYASWRDYFDIIITNAAKPKFFQQGSILREVDNQGRLKWSAKPKEFKRGVVYTGGSFSLFRTLTKTMGSEVLYVGDNIWGDIIFSRKSKCYWRTMFIVRELDVEQNKWNANQQKYNYLENLKYLRTKSFSGMTSSDKVMPNYKELKKKISQCTQEWDNEFNPYYGSLFRTNGKQSHFAHQTQRYSDIYTSRVTNLINYPLFYVFGSFGKRIPHELEQYGGENQKK
mmetsp:Transcript_6722/g.9763  ORF Transcript_6722/g.9763 Transcript_6722/m.9763 type:complete len:614 (+) Transcript_6722:13-1854(+)